MSKNQDTAPGMPLPTKQGMLGSTPGESAHQQNVNTAAKAQNLKNAVGGGIEVPQYNNPGYTPQNGPGQDPNSQIAKNSSNGTQQHANGVYDKQAMKGGKYGKKGGQGWSYKNNSDWNWGCMSGGKKKKTRTKRRKIKKTRSNRKRRTRRKRNHSRRKY